MNRVFPNFTSLPNFPHTKGKLGGLPVLPAAAISITPASVYNGTTLVAGGTLAMTFTVTGTGAAPTQDASGLTFTGGKSLRCDPSPIVNYEEALIVIDYTRNGDPTGGSGTVFSLDVDFTSRMVFRYTASGPSLSIPNGVASLRSYGAQNGQRSTYAMHYNSAAGTVTVADNDGLISNPSPGAGTAVGLNRIDIGISSNVTIHSVDVYLFGTAENVTAAILPLWQAKSGITLTPYSTTLLEYHPEIGQSVSLGPNDGPARVTFANENRQGALMINGLKRSDGASIFVHGPSAGVIDTAVPETSISSATVAANSPVKLGAAVSEAKIRQSMGLPVVPHIVQCVSVSGQRMIEFDDDTPPTGTLGPVVYNNVSYVMSEAKRLAAAAGKTLRIPTLSILQGTADRDLARGVWRARAEDVVATWRSVIAGLTGDNPDLYVYQEAGLLRTDTDAWNVKMDQIDLVVAGATLIAPVYPIEVDNTGHPMVPGMRLLADLFNWARAAKDAGQAWNLIPTVSRSGSTITVTVTCRDDESLVLAPDDKYGGVGITNHGFEVDGATITDVSVSGNTATITTTGGTPTQVRYAFQSQNLSTQPAPYYPAHRGLLRTSLSKTTDGRTSYRWVPGFKVDV